MSDDNSIGWFCNRCRDAWSMQMGQHVCDDHDRELPGVTFWPDEQRMSYEEYLEAQIWDGQISDGQNSRSSSPTSQISRSQSPTSQNSRPQTSYFRNDFIAELMSRGMLDQSGSVCHSCRGWYPAGVTHQPCHTITTDQLVEDLPIDQSMLAGHWLIRLAVMEDRRQNPDLRLLNEQSRLRASGLEFTCYICEERCLPGQQHQPCPWICAFERLFNHYYPRPTQSRSLNPRSRSGSSHNRSGSSRRSSVSSHHRSRSPRRRSRSPQIVVDSAPSGQSTTITAGNAPLAEWPYLGVRYFGRRLD